MSKPAAHPGRFVRPWLPLAVGLLAGPVWSEDAPPADLRLYAALMTVIAESDGPTPFASDGCSGGMSSLWALTARLSPGFVAAHGDTLPWEACCIAHDRLYHSAGQARMAAESWQARLMADRALRRCVADAAPEDPEALQETLGIGSAQLRGLYRALATGMFYAVRFVGTPCSGLPWRWGYGYRSCLAELRAAPD